MKLDDLRKRLRRGIKPKRAQKSTCGDSERLTSTKITTQILTCEACRCVQTVEVFYRERSPDSGELAWFMRKKWQCVECGAHSDVRV